MLKDIQRGDIIYVWKLDRLARNAVDLYQTAKLIEDRGATLVVLTMPGMDTGTPVGKAMFGMLAVFAEFERAIAYERTMAGLKAARNAGRPGGRAARFTDKQVLEAHRLHGVAGGARSLVYKVKGKERHMSLAGFRKALERAQKAESGE